MKKKILTILLSTAMIFSMGISTVSAAADDTASTESIVVSKTEGITDTAYGKVRGFIDDGTYTFRGIPYAKADRFEMPEAPDTWDDIRNCLVYGSTAPITKMTDPDGGDFLIPHRYWAQSENCQNLNIWTQDLDSNAKKPVMVFLHGGGYVAEATASHRRIIEELVKMYGLKVTFIDYPLAPEHTYEKTHKIVMKAYREITIKNYGDEFYLFGDSAGGGLALAVLQILRDEKMIPFPKKTVLMSPWVDLTMSNPKIGEAAERDPLLTMDCLYHAAERYIGNGDVKNPVLSPIFGRMDNLGKIFLLTGTHEILNPDCRKLKTKLMAAYGTELEFYEGEKMVHDWILATPFYLEAFKAIEMVGEFYVNG